MKKMEY